MILEATVLLLMFYAALAYIIGSAILKGDKNEPKQ